MLTPENADGLARTILPGCDRAQVDAFFDLIKGLAGPQPPPNAPLDQKRRYDCAYAVLLAAFPLTSRCYDVFRAEVETIQTVSDLAA